MAKKDLHDEQLKEGLEALKQAGVSIENPSVEIIPRLREQFGKTAAGDLAAAYALGKVADPASLELLKEMERAAASKEIKREIKRSLFKLAQRGIKSADEETAAAKPVVFEQPADIEAYMSSVDGGGGRLIWIVKPQPGHGLQVIQAMIQEPEGLVRVAVLHLRRKELRGMMQEIKVRHDVTMIPVPWEYADRSIYQGYERAKEHGHSDLENYYELRTFFTAGKPKDLPHPIYSRLDAAEAREGAWRESSRRLLDEPELRYWVIADDWIQDFLPRLEEAQTSRLVLNPVQKEERFAAIVREAVKQLCSGESGVSFARRMEDTALYFLETGRPDMARLSVALAQQVREGDPGPLDVSFLTGLIQKSFALFMSKEKTRQEQARDSLLIKA